MSNVELIAQLERILPGLENSSSAAEDAMIRALPKVIAALSRAKEMEVALQEIADRHVPDQPAAYDVPEADYIRKHHMELRMIARSALKGDAALGALSGERNAGIEVACKLIDKKAVDYIQEFGSYDPSTGVYEFSTAGEEYLGTLAELAEEIRALKGGAT